MLFSKGSQIGWLLTVLTPMQLYDAACLVPWHVECHFMLLVASSPHGVEQRRGVGLRTHARLPA